MKRLRWQTRASWLKTRYLEAVIVKCVIADEEHTWHIHLVITCVTFATKVEYEILFFLRCDRFVQLRPVGSILRYHNTVLVQEAVFGGEASKNIIAHSAERRRSGARESVYHLNIATTKTQLAIGSVGGYLITYERSLYLSTISRISST